MQRKKGASFRDFFLISPYSRMFLSCRKDCSHYETQPSSVGSLECFCANKDVKEHFLILTSFKPARGKDFHNVNFSNCLCSISTVKRVTHSNFKIACNKKNLRFSALFYMYYGWSNGKCLCIACNKKIKLDSMPHIKWNEWMNGKTERMKNNDKRKEQKNIHFHPCIHYKWSNRKK